jgi:hypothetical protein
VNLAGHQAAQIELALRPEVDLVVREAGPRVIRAERKRFVRHDKGTFDREHTARVLVDVCFRLPSR